VCDVFFWFCFVVVVFLKLPLLIIFQGSMRFFYCKKICFNTTGLAETDRTGLFQVRVGRIFTWKYLFAEVKFSSSWRAEKFHYF